MVSDPRNYFEERLRSEIEAIEGKIAELRLEQNALKRQLMKARWETHALKDVSRKNSANRVMVEQRVLEELRSSGKAVSTAALYKAALIANFELKENTFRTYLHRMKEKGLIHSQRRGFWTLSDQLKQQA